LEVEPVVKLDRLLEPAPGRGRTHACSFNQYSPQLGLNRRPAPLGIVVPTDDAKGISLVDKSGERVKDRWMTLRGAAQFPDAFRLRRREAQLALLVADFEIGVIGDQRDGDEIDDVAVQDQTPWLALR